MSASLNPPENSNDHNYTGYPNWLSNMRVVGAVLLTELLERAATSSRTELNHVPV